MNDRLQKFVAELESIGQKHDASGVPHAERHLNLEAATAELVAMLIRITKPKHVLEVGTSTGISAIWIADALVSSHGHLTSLERDAKKSAEAGRNLKAAGFDGNVTLLLGDATEIIRDLPGPFDCVFFDADRISAPEQVDLLLSKLNRPALLLADNVISHPSEIRGYMDKVQSLNGAQNSVVSVGKGLSITYLPS